MKKIFNKINIIWRILFTFPSRLIFGNCIAIHKNIYPLFQFFFIKKIFKKKTELEKNGIIKVKYNLDKNIISDTKKHFDILIDDPKNQKSLSGKQVLIYNPLELRNLRKIIEIFDQNLREYYEGNYKFINLVAWRNYHDSSKHSNREKYVYSNYWHYDHYRTDILKIFILLNNNTNKNTGSTKVIDIKNSKIVSRSFKFIDTSLSNKKLEEHLNKKNLINYCSGDMGDVYIINTSKCLHSATIPEKNYLRDLIQFEVIKSKINEDPFDNIIKKNQIL